MCTKIAKLIEQNNNPVEAANSIWQISKVILSPFYLGVDVIW